MELAEPLLVVTVPDVHEPVRTTRSERVVLSEQRDCYVSERVVRS